MQHLGTGDFVPDTETSVRQKEDLLATDLLLSAYKLKRFSTPE